MAVLTTRLIGLYTVLHNLGKAGKGWVEKHVAFFVPINGPTLGSPKALVALISGDTGETLTVKVGVSLRVTNIYNK